MRSIYLGIFLVAMAVLVMELVLTRAFDVILAPNMAYMVITCAMFSIGLAGIYGALRPFHPPHIRRTLASLTLGFALSTLALRPLLNLLPFNYDEITAAPGAQAVYFLGMYLALAVPFFLAGLVFTALFSVFTSRIQSLYFFDLVGAGVGCVLLIPLIKPIGPGGLLFGVAALGLLASALFAGNRAWAVAAVVGAVALAVMPVLRMPDYFAFREHVDKRAVSRMRAKGMIELTRWDPISKIDVLDVKGKHRKHIAYDGGQQSSNYYEFDGDFAGLRQRIESGVDPIDRHFWFSGVIASHYLKRDSDQSVLIIGSAGGQETKAALTYGAASVDAVEMVGAVIDLARNEYSDYTGALFLDPRVRCIRAEGRSFLRGTDQLYDIIQIFSNHTSSSVGGGSGAMSPHYLQTVEAYREYFEHLNDDGILHINHHVFPRMLTTAAQAWKEMGRRDLQRHVVVLRRPAGRDNLPTLLIKMSLWHQTELDELTRLAALSKTPQVLVENPLHPERSSLSSDFYSGAFPEELADRMSYRVEPPTDDQPYFNFLRRHLGKVEADPELFLHDATAWVLNARTRKFVPMDVIHLIVTGVVSLTFAFAFLLLPLRFSEVGRATWARRAPTLVYFSSLGAGFIIIELVLIQIFMKLVGFPLYAISTVLLTMLVAAGLGSIASSRIGIRPDHRWTWPFVGIAVFGGAMALSYPFVIELFLSQPLPLRVGVSFALIFPLGFVLGMPFPLGILSIERMPPGSVAWAWAMNGLFTLIGGLVSTALSIFIGFHATLILGLSIYAVAFLALSQLNRATEFRPQLRPTFPSSAPMDGS